MKSSNSNELKDYINLIPNKYKYLFGNLAPMILAIYFGVPIMIAIKNNFHLSEPLDLLLPYLLFFSLFFIYAKLQARLLILVSDILGIDEEIEWLASVIIGIVAIIIIYKFY